MKFIELAQYFEKIEQESSRNNMTKLLAELFEQATASEAQLISYLSLGSLFPPYKTLQLNIAKKGMLAIIAKLVDKDLLAITDQFKKSGDVGLVTAQLWSGKETDLSVQDVYDGLVVCAKLSGTGSTEKRFDYLVKLLRSVDTISAKYIARIVTGTLRLGFSDMTIIDALSWMQVGDKSIRKNLEHAYNICADLGLVAYRLKEKGLEAVAKMQIQVGIPIRPSAAERLSSAQAIIDKLGPCVAQPKLDGFRLQIHVKQIDDRKEVHFFSRNLLDMSNMFPDLVKVVEHLDVSEVIFEGEAIVYDETTDTFLPFQQTVKRKRKHGVKEASQELPLRLYVFDLLYVDGRSMLTATHQTRRDRMKVILSKNSSVALQLIEEKKVVTGEQLHNYFLMNLHAGLEGLVVKREDATYQPGKRNFNWIKLKRHARGTLTDTVDCVILGYYFGAGKRATFGIGAFLVGVYNSKMDQFESVAKVGTGMKDHEWKDLRNRCKDLEVQQKPHNVEVAKDLYPDVWVRPELVCVIQCEEITQSPIHTAGKTRDSLGFALRFPRFISYRIDKSATDTTSVTELQSLFNQQ